VGVPEGAITHAFELDWKLAYGPLHVQKSAPGADEEPEGHGEHVVPAPEAPSELKLAAQRHVAPGPGTKLPAALQTQGAAPVETAPTGQAAHVGEPGASL